VQSAFGRNVAQNKQLAREQFETAERMRQELIDRPVANRSQQDYKRVIDAYRRVYYLAPGSGKADPSVFTVAQLLGESGRQFNNSKTLHSAIEQYQFLRREYPGSKYRVQALFAIGEIYKDDLSDRQQAKAAFEEFLKHYPHSQRADDAQAALQELQQPPEKAKKRGVRELAGRAADKEPERPPQKLERVSGKEAEREEAAPSRNGGLPQVMGVRHWSTADYTRVAIDLESQVEYQAGRVPDPDRIFFDLHGTKLAAGFVGRSIEVQDGLLRKIRIAQYQKDMTRVVLEVDNVADYSAFLLPNPYRLIIDVHGRQSARKGTAPPPRIVPPPAVASPATTRASVPPPVQETVARAVSPVLPPAGSSRTGDSAPVPQAGATPPAAVALLKSVGPAPTQSSLLPPQGAAPQAPDSETQKPTESAVSTRSSRTGAAKNAGDLKPPEEVAKAAGDGRASEAKMRKGEQTSGDSEAAPTPAKTGPSLHGAPDRHGPGTPVDGDLVVARLDSPELKSSKPTTAPTYESVAPRTPPAAGKRRTPAENEGHEARPAANGERTLTRALGLKVGRIVVDAGHGGHDTGTVGPGGLQEKDLTLDVARRLGKLLETKLGAEVIYTRNDDSFVPLETRTAIANQNQADLFISIHANSSRDASARGVETYYLNFTSSPEALEVAARENAVSQTSVHELQDLVKKIALKEKVGESHEFAGEVQKSLWSGLATKSPGLRNRGVKKAPFIVLIGANMPSVLAEISFLSNPADERRLKTPEYRQRIAEYLYTGITHYASGLSGVKVAQKR
jgi:N-acetylmuramoyl-L-alanine amidase